MTSCFILSVLPSMLLVVLVFGTFSAMAVDASIEFKVSFFVVYWWVRLSSVPVDLLSVSQVIAFRLLRGIWIIQVYHA